MVDIEKEHLEPREIHGNSRNIRDLLRKRNIPLISTSE